MFAVFEQNVLLSDPGRPWKTQGGRKWMSHSTDVYFTAADTCTGQPGVARASHPVIY